MKIRSVEKELLDADEIPVDDLRQNLRELDTINHYLGGHTITVKGIKVLLKKQKYPISVLDIGSGGGDTLKAIAKWNRKIGVIATLTGVDIKTDCINFAEEACKNYPEINFIQSDYRNLNYSDQKPDIIVSSLFCHHLTDNELISFLQWMNETAQIGFIINDLHRHPLAFQSIRLLTNLFSKSYLVKNDAKLSVARGFTKDEWLVLFHNAHLKQPIINWKWAFRHLIIAKTNET